MKQKRGEQPQGDGEEHLKDRPFFFSLQRHPLKIALRACARAVCVEPTA